MNSQDLLSLLDNVKRSNKGWTAKCPAHDDRENSLSIGEGDGGRVLLKCFAGCSAADIVCSIGLNLKDLFPQNNDSASIPREDAAHLHTPEQRYEKTRENDVQGDATLCSVQPGLTLAVYAKAKNLPEEFLKSVGLNDCKYQKAPAVRIPYFNQNGHEVAVRFRVAMNGRNKFRWRSGDKVALYGLSRLNGHQDYILLVEGESDCHTCWYHDLHALGLPGASSFNNGRDAQHFDGISRIYIIREPDQGGLTVEKWLEGSTIRDRVHLIELGEHKDPSGLYLADPALFLANMRQAMAAAVPWSEIAKRRREEELKASWSQCSALALAPSILDSFEKLLPRCGLAGEQRAAKILFLCLISRMFERPTSVAIDGPSSGGKSHLVETVLKFFPKAVYHDLSAMSERNLAYTEEDLKNRFLILYEAAGLGGEIATYLIRSLLSEGRIRYEFVEKTSEGLQSRLIEKEGPTGLIMTTTSTWIHPENATRMITVTVNDSQEQTSRVLLSLAQQKVEPIEFGPWHALQEHIQRRPCSVWVPYAPELARLTKPLAVRLRRDFAALLSLIKAHALLHQASRTVDAQGRVVAELQDYSVVLGLVGEIIAQTVDAGVPESVKETVEAATAAIEESDTEHTTTKKIAEMLKIDRSSATRRVKTAIGRGYLQDAQEKKGKPKKIIVGDPLPAETNIFPSVEELEGCASERAVQKAEKICTPQELEESQQDPEGVCRCVGGEGGQKDQTILFEEGVL